MVLARGVIFGWVDPQLVVAMAADEALVVNQEVAPVVTVLADFLRESDHPEDLVLVTVDLDHDRHLEPDPPFGHRPTPPKGVRATL